METSQTIKHPFAEITSVLSKQGDSVLLPRQTRETNPFYQFRARETQPEVSSAALNNIFSIMRQKQATNSISAEKIATEYLRNEIALLSNVYTFYESSIIKKYLVENRFLIPLLNKIPETIQQYFSAKQNLGLKVSFESESPQASELWVLILTELPATKAFPLLEAFDESWWINNLEKANCKLNIRLEFV